MIVVRFFGVTKPASIRNHIGPTGSFEITSTSNNCYSHLLVCGVDFTILFEYSYFGGFSADKIRRRIWLAIFFSGFLADKNLAANLAIGGGLGSSKQHAMYVG